MAARAEPDGGQKLIERGCGFCGAARANFVCAVFMGFASDPLASRPAVAETSDLQWHDPTLYVLVYFVNYDHFSCVS